MERPAKRLRIGLAPYDDKEDDELGLEPEEFEQLELSKDPGYQLEQGRAKAAYKLKSTFEHIFEKYEKDFTDVGDEIDLRTGEIVVDNGHLQSMKDARDDAASQAGRTEDARSEADSIEEEERILHGGKIGPDGSSTALAVLDDAFLPNAFRSVHATEVFCFIRYPERPYRVSLASPGAPFFRFLCCV
ncbi:putative myb-like dna-binding domain protein [Phaeoacremonium minimum UCRPA7]|uniref:Putative myb-like dna-binding domain protein n=1 Tax=Phaeoacremonium minimum (strain UCR-PA7) TaxID=1286976 RepID=R8BN95_PHAM7|nr:putative myb-like dna-binding domain protein [Phaeoacremonium minimum UCRPA7]EOO00816.1 putative myb-like dna-binding domain protein [Phaeoacremonium minimum UCRPA7]